MPERIEAPRCLCTGSSQHTWFYFVLKKTQALLSRWKHLHEHCVALCFNAVSQSSERDALQSSCFKRTSMAAAKLGQPWRGLVWHVLVLCVVECCVPQGLPVKLIATPVS